MSAVSVSSFCGLFSKAIAATFLVMSNSQAFLLLEGLVASAVISCGHKGSFVGKEEI